MRDIVHARLDENTRKILLRLKRRYGWSDSEVVRQGIRALSETETALQDRAKQIVGLGKFKSGISDLGSNKDHLRNFGR
jgi:Arc/MetJ-type ribon-helix-helix transcriptional regulator